MIENKINISKIIASSRKCIKKTAELAKKYGMDAFLVGGAVRDAILHKRVYDLDFTFNRISSEFVEDFMAEYGVSVVKEHPKFLTRSIKLKGGEKIDFATFRSESYPVAADLPVVSSGSMVEDLFRRDFTINAMSVSLVKNSTGAIIDPYGGLKDLNDGVLRVMHCRSFTDDPTRIFRLARFLTRFGFKKDISTEISLETVCRDKLVLKLTPARIKNEFAAIFREKDPGASLKLLDEWGVLESVHPMLKFCPKMRFSAEGNYGYLNMAVLLQYWKPEEAFAFIERLQIPGSDRQRIIPLIFLAQKMCRQMPVNSDDLKNVDFQVLARMNGITAASLNRLKKKADIKKLITGDDLKKMGFLPGPEFKKILSFVSQAIESGEVCSRREAKKLIFDNFTHQR